MIASRFCWCVAISDVATELFNATLPSDAMYAVEMPPELEACDSRAWCLRKVLYPMPPETNSNDVGGGFGIN